jgi:hypothetical protein
MKRPQRAPFVARINLTGPQPPCYCAAVDRNLNLNLLLSTLTGVVVGF